MYISKRAKYALAFLTFGTLAFIYLPLITVVINSFNPSRTFSWPPQSLSTTWWGKVGQSGGLINAIGFACQLVIPRRQQLELLEQPTTNTCRYCKIEDTTRNTRCNMIVTNRHPIEWRWHITSAGKFRIARP